MAGGDTATLSLCVYSAELESAANGAYCKIYVDAHDRTNGSGGGGGGGGGASDATSPDPSSASSRSSDGVSAPRSFHTHVEKSDKKTYLPTWNETFTINVYDRRSEILTIRLKAKKLLHVSVVGACAIPLHQIPTNQPVDQWFPVQKGGKRRGKLRLKMMLTTAPASVPSTPPLAPSASRMSLQSPPQQQQLFDHRRTGSLRSSTSMSQRPSSLSSQPSDAQPQTLGGRWSPPAITVQQQQAAAYNGFEPEDEPAKDKSPIKAETYEIYRPATNPRVDLESDDDDETSFPRVAELHRLESDLIGESSDEETEVPLALKSPQYLEPLTEDSGSAGEEHLSPSSSSNGRASSARGSNAAAAFDQEASLEEFKPQALDEAKAAGDRRVSVEVTRQTKVTMTEQDMDHMLELSAISASSYDDVDEEGIESSAHSSSASDIVVGEVVAPEVGEEIWNRYSSSSSEELQLPYPDEDVEVPRSSGSSIPEGVEVSIHEANPFVEPASPSHSDEDQQEEVDAAEHDATSPRTSWVSDGADSATHREKAMSGTSWVSERDSGEHTETRTSWVSEQSERLVVQAGRDKSESGTSWVTEHEAGATTSPRHSWVSDKSDAHASAPSPSPPKRFTARDKSWSGTSWVSEHESTSFIDATGPRSSWISEEGESVADESLSARHSWVSDAPSESPAKLKSRDKSWSGTSWVNENESTSFVDATGPRSSWISEKGESVVDEGSSPRHSWVSEAPTEAPAKLTGRDKSWSGTSWVSEHDNSSFVDAASPPRSSWISEKGESVVGDKASPRHSWVSDAPSESPAKLTGRDKSWSGTSWVNENESSSFVDATGPPRSSWISEKGESVVGDSSSPRHSWVSEAPSESPAKLTGRDKSWSGTSWISEHDNNSFADAAGPPGSTSRSSWVSENSENDANPDSFDAVPDGSTRTSWIHEDGAAPAPRLTGRDKSWSGTSWISEHDNTSFVDATGLRSSWINDDAETDDLHAPSPQNSWVSEDGAESPARLTGRDKSWSGTSWISENDNSPSALNPEAEEAGSPRSSWVSEHSDQPEPRLTGRDKSWSGTSWVSDQDNTSFVSASAPHVGSPRSSWTSEGNSPVPAVHAVGSPRSSWVSEAESKPESPRHSWVSDRDHGAATHSPRTSWVSESGVTVVPAPAPDSVEAVLPPRTSLLSDVSDIIEGEHRSSPRSSISAGPTSESTSQADTFVSELISSTSSVETPEPLQPSATTDRLSHGSYSSDEGSARARLDDATTPRVSVSSERLSMEDDASSAPRVSFVSDEPVPEVALDADLSTTPPVDVSLSVEAEFADHGSSDEGRSSGYEGDNLASSTTRSSSVFSDQAREHETVAQRMSSSSSSDGDEFGPSSYTDLTRHSSISSAGVETVVVRDDAELHAEAVAEAARYSSSSEGEFEREDRVEHTISLNTELHASRHYSSASEEDTVDRNSSAVGFDYDDLSTAGRSHSSSTAARDEAQFAAWTEESSTNGDFSDAMRRVSQMSGTSDMYDASPRVSEDLGAIPESHGRASVDSPSSAEAPVETDMRRFISSVNVFVEPYEEETPRSSTSTDVATQKVVTVTVEVAKEAKAAPVNPFVEYGSPGSSSSSDEEVMEVAPQAPPAPAVTSTRSSVSSEGDHEVVVVETLDQLDSHKAAVTAVPTVTVEPKPAVTVTTAPVETKPVVAPARVSFSEESKSDAQAETDPRANVRGGHVLVSMASTLTRAQLDAVAQDYLPSDSESESDEYDSDADLNFDSD